MNLNIGDLVGRKSHGLDILFKIESFSADGKTVYLKGTDLRLIADAPYEDLELLNAGEINRHRQKYIRKSSEILTKLQKHRLRNVDNFLSRAKINYKKDLREPEIFELPGSVLHIDGDKEYLNLCMNTYRQLNIKAVGFCVNECEQANVIKDYLLEYMPDILILTGHDGILKGRKNFSNLENYRNSANFVRAKKVVGGALVGIGGIKAAKYVSKNTKLIEKGARLAKRSKTVRAINAKKLYNKPLNNDQFSNVYTSWRGFEDQSKHAKRVRSYNFRRPQNNSKMLPSPEYVYRWKTIDI